MSEEVVEATEVLTPERVTGIPDMDDSPSVAVIMESLDTNEDMMDAVAAAIVDSPAGNADAGGEAADESPQRRSRRKRGMQSGRCFLVRCTSSIGFATSFFLTICCPLVLILLKKFSCFKECC